MHKNGIKGDVIYYSPCSKKLRTFQEIERVNLEQNKNINGFNFLALKYKFLVFEQEFQRAKAKRDQSNARQLHVQLQANRGHVFAPERALSKLAE